MEKLIVFTLAVVTIVLLIGCFTDPSPTVERLEVQRLYVLPPPEATPGYLELGGGYTL